MDKISFSVNGVKYSVGTDVSSDVMLLDYLRNHLELRGTKYMCREGGCGACIVAAARYPGEDLVAVNSCLVSVTSCHDWEITTIEKVGNRKEGYHPIQKTLAKYNGTQCGYCTPGWVMSMYSLLKSKTNLTKLQLEESFGSNICRCTGYRPILEAFKKFSKDNLYPINLPDIEDLKICKKSVKGSRKNHCLDDDWCFVSKDGDDKSNISLKLKDGKLWFKVTNIDDIFDIFTKNGDDSYMLIGGNTAKGAYPIDEYPSVLIDISGVSQLKGWELDQNLEIGAGTTLTELLDIFELVSNTDEFSYLKTFYSHLNKVAHIPVRNIGTIAGNLMTKHKHNSFTSDIYLLLYTVDAQLKIRHYQGQENILSMEEFLKTDMKGKVILKAYLPPLNQKHKIVTYKIMPRYQNAHAIVNAGFLFELSCNDNVVQKCRIVYSGLIPPSSRASLTEKYLLKRKLYTNETLQGALSVLEKELEAVENLPEPSPKYRKRLALSLFYKCILSLCPTEKIQSRYRSGATNIHEMRPVSKGQQIYDTDPSLYPLNQPLEKLEALRQCSGEVPYTEDLPSFPKEVFAALVLSTEGSGQIVHIDPSEALNQPGVIEFYSAKDIPGLNSFTPPESAFFLANEEILCSGSLQYFNQPLGIIVAESRQLAEKAAKMVHVDYKNMKKPIIDIKEAKEYENRLHQFAILPATENGLNIAKTIKGETAIYHQYHFCMETLVCVTRPSEDGLEVHASTQWSDGIQFGIAKALKIDTNSVDVYVRRLGGGFGFKISRSIQTAIVSALVAKKLNRPCRVIQELTTNLRAAGKRFPCSSTYEAKVNKHGVIQHVDYKIFSDNGHEVSLLTYTYLIESYFNAYKKTRWNFIGYNVTTDTAKNASCRAPGSLEAIGLAETLMERIAYEMSVDPVKVRLANLDELYSVDIIEMYETLKSNSDYEVRRMLVDKFNSENRWKKRGLRVSFMRWGASSIAPILSVNISIYHVDGAVVITHSGIEMGQGINTKAVQIAAYFLNIPVDKIKVKGNNTIIGPNCFGTGNSITSQSVGFGVQKCCEKLLARLAPVRLLLPLASWEELVKKAYDLQVDLQSHSYVKNTDGVQYNVYGVCFAEVEVDILTGESEIIRVDLLEDAGRTINPDIDIGQIEGAFVMGIGYWTSEKLVFNKENGEVLSDRTWNYYVPQARDIPQDFRVYLRKKSYSAPSILGSKGIGEPPMTLSVVITFAIREAIVSSRLESCFPTNEWFDIDGPYTLEAIALATETKIEDFKLN